MGLQSDMNVFTIEKGLDLPLKGQPEQKIRDANEVRHVALIGDDYIGLKPTMLVQVGDRVKLGQPLFIDKKNPEVLFTAPGCGIVKAVNRGAKRKFESLVIELEGDDEIVFEGVKSTLSQEGAQEHGRNILAESGLWTALRSRPFGKVAAFAGTPSSIFITATDTNPLAADPEIIIAENKELFVSGLQSIHKIFNVPVHLCYGADSDLNNIDVDGVNAWQFTGLHPAGLPSTHIHFIDPVHAEKQVWHVSYQDVIRIGQLFSTGKLRMDTVVALGGECFHKPSLVRTRLGASLVELCEGELNEMYPYRLLSGSVLDGRADNQVTGYLGRYHHQISTVIEGSGRSLFGWMAPGKDRFSVTRLFLSAFGKDTKSLSFKTAAWGGRRAIFPLDVYQQVIPLDIIAIGLLKSIAVGDTEKSQDLGCLELIEEDLALCSYVCPGKNEFGLMLRDVLTKIEKEG